MDAKSAQDNLNALQTLYGRLLKSDRGLFDDDDNARRMLKNLLDEETKRSVKTVLEIVSRQADEPSSADDEKPIQRSEEIDPIQPSTTSEATQNCTMSSSKEKALSRQGTTMEGGCNEKLCRLCRRNTVKKIDDVALSSKTSTDPQVLQQSNLRSDKSTVEAEANRQEGEVLSEDVSKSIKHIGLCLSVLQLAADENFHSNSAQLHTAETRISQRKDEDDDVDRGIMTSKLRSENTSLRLQGHVDFPENRAPTSPAQAQPYSRLADKPSQLNTVPSLPGNRSHHPQIKEGISNKRARRGEKESYSSASSSSYASNSDDHSSSEEPLNDEYMTPTTISESPLLSPDLQSNYSSYTEDSEKDDIYSPEGSRGATASFSSDEESSSYDRESPHNHPKPKRYLNQPTSKGKSAYKAKTGTLKRFIERLAIIFHHHHYHHHRHATKMGRRTSKRKAEAHAEKAVEKIKGRNQLGHFNGLMGGFLRHAKKQKQTMGEYGQGGRRCRGSKTTLKKSNWLKLVKHHRRAKMAGALGKKKTTIKSLAG